VKSAASCGGGSKTPGALPVHADAKDPDRAAPGIAGSGTLLRDVAEDLPMTDDDLDRSYSAMCAALANVGQEKSHLFLSMICLSLMARYERAEDVLPLIANVQAQCAAEVAEGG
jgi:hypothetical protein